MDYMTLKEAAEKWGVTPRRVNYYCAAGRISGAVKMATIDVYKRQVVFNIFLTPGKVLWQWGILHVTEEGLKIGRASCRERV